MLHGGITRNRQRFRRLAYMIFDIDTADIEFLAVTDSVAPPITDVSEISHETYGECCICLEKSSDVREFKCGHIMHEDCSLKWFEQSNTCPVCRIYF